MVRCPPLAAYVCGPFCVLGLGRTSARDHVCRPSFVAYLRWIVRRVRSGTEHPYAGRPEHKLRRQPKSVLCHGGWRRRSGYIPLMSTCGHAFGLRRSNRRVQRGQRDR